MVLPPWISGASSGNTTSESRFPSTLTTKVKNAKKPKSRPARGWRDTILFPVRSLPTYSGSYHVGTMEIEVPVREPRTFSHIKRHGRHVLQLKTVLLTIYYPASPPNNGNHKPSRQLWLGRPRLGVAKGYGKFATVGSLGIPMFLPTMFTKIPAWRNAPLSHRLPGDDKSGADSEEDGDPPQFPLMVFSHGLGGTRTAYSTVCGEFASYGFVVFALEHRDGSGPRTYVNQPEGKEVNLDGEFDQTKDKYLGRTYKRRGVETKYDVVDYIFPKGNRWDTSPTNEKGVDSELRGAQLDMRLSEIEEAYDVIRQINDGKGAHIAAQNLRRKNFIGSSSHGLDGVDWSTWKGRIRMKDAVAAGHSFGGATITDMLRHEDRFNWISQGIIYDTWGGGTRPPSTTNDKIHAPLLAINSEAFTYWSKNYELVKSLIKEASPSPAWLLTVRGTVHINQSDFSILYPNVCSLFLKMTADPSRALDINVNASLEFLKMVMPRIPEEIEAAFPNEGILSMDEMRLYQIPEKEKHMPQKEKYIAGKLSIPHEFFWRSMPKAARKVSMKSKADPEAKGPQGEVWLHWKPDEACIRTHTSKAKKEPNGQVLGDGDPGPRVHPGSVPCNEDDSGGN